MSNSNPADLYNGDSQDRFGHVPVEGVIVSTPDTTTDLVHVAIPTFDEDQSDALRWMPRGSNLPAIGDTCLVSFTQSGTAWVSAWWPSGAETDAPPKTPATTDDGGDGPTTTGVVWMPGVRKLVRPSAGTWAVDCAPKGILHTTEGAGDATSTLDANGDHPHFQVEQGGRITQYIPVNRAAKALKHTGSPETNRAHAVQIEVCGFAATTSWPSAQKTAVRKVMRFIEANAGVERASHVPFVTGSSERLSGSAWIATGGWLGHQHVPQNDHYDPGAITIGDLL